jgi:hypothetical protein
LKIKPWINGKRKKKRKWCAHDKKLIIFIFESYACCTIKRDITELSKVIGVLKPFGNLFIPCRVSLVGYIQPSQTFSSDSRDLPASTCQTYPTPGRIYLTYWIYPSLVRF